MTMLGNEHTTDLLIVGAGPYGLALAAYAEHLGIDHLVAGHPMAFWRDHMPHGMVLRSASDWHLDPTGVDTIDAWAAEQGRTPDDIHPISRADYLAYTAWFQRRKGIAPTQQLVTTLDRTQDGSFRATLTNGNTVHARRVVIAVGFGAFPHVPDDLARRLPPGRFAHTCDDVDCAVHAGRRVLIVGGRQSAYEWAALLREAGAAAVHIAHRQAAPAFAEADWSWVSPLVDGMVANPGWYRRLEPEGKEKIARRLYAEGRLKVEPWLEPRVLRDGTHRWPYASIASSVSTHDGDLAVTLDTGHELRVDHIILATGYRVRIERMPLLANGNILPDLATRDGFPVLSERFETSVPGFHITSMPATQDFGPMFAFTIAARMSARVIGDHLAATAATTSATSAATTAT